MISVDACFVCTTPFQLINALVMTEQFKIEADLYIVPQFAKSEEYYQRLLKLNCFRKIVLVDTSKIERYKNKRGIIKKFGIVRNYLLINDVVESFLIPNTNYRVIYISSKANIGRLLCFYMIHNSYSTEFCYFDDGEGSYDNSELYKPSFSDCIIRKILFGRKSVELSNKIYLYSEKLYHSINPQSNMDVKELPNWTKNTEIKQEINSLCGYSEKCLISKKFVFLDTISEEVFEPEMANYYNELRDDIMDRYGNKVIIKKHPRDKSNTKFSTYHYQDIPFEVVCANSDISSKVLICVSSTAIAMPKILFDREPIVILLYKITPTKAKGKENSEQQFFYEKIKSLYRNPDRFFIPSSKEELFAKLDDCFYD